MSVSRTVSEIFSGKEWRGLETGVGVVQGNCKWRRSIDDFLLVRHCIYSFIWYRFWTTWRWKISWPWNLG